MYWYALHTVVAEQKVEVPPWTPGGGIVRMDDHTGALSYFCCLPEDLRLEVETICRVRGVRDGHQLIHWISDEVVDPDFKEITILLTRARRSE